MSRRENLLAFMEAEQKKKKGIKIGKLSKFSTAGLESITPTLHLPIDALTGGIPKGVIYEIYGQESSGKSSTVLKVLENWRMTLPEDKQKSVLYVDSEGK